MKKIFFVVITLTVFIACAAEISAEELKIGYVNMQKIFSEYKKTQAAEAELEKKGKAKSEERNKMVEDVRRLKDESELLSDKGKEEKQAEIDTKIKALQDFDRLVRGELVEEREGVLREISVDIDKAIEDYGKKNKYDLILNKDKRVLIYDKGDLDITESVLRALNK